MDSEFDNIKEVDYYTSRNLYPSEENTTTSNSRAIDAKPIYWRGMEEQPNDNLNNIINEEVKQTTTTTNNGQFDDNLLYSSDNIDLKEKILPPEGDDNNLHHASTLENNGEELVAAGYDNKNEFSTGFDNDQQRMFEKNQPHHQQLGDADADYGPETCVDVTDDVVMMTENSADTNNLLEQSTLSHSKDTLPSSDNCNPFDNKNILDMEDANEYQLGSGGVDAHIQLDDANKATPLLSPEMEDLPLSCEGGLQYTNEGFQQSPLDEIPAGIDQGHIEFDHEFTQNGHLSPEKLDAPQKTEEEQEDIESLDKLQRFGDLEEEKVQKEQSKENVDEAAPQHQETDLDEDVRGNVGELSVNQQKENSFDKGYNDECDFRLKDEEEILEKHVDVSSVQKDLHQFENKVLDLNQREELQQALHNLEDVVLEEKPILTGNIPDVNFDDCSIERDEEKIPAKKDDVMFVEKELHRFENEVLDLNQTENLQDPRHNIEDVVLEKKTILEENVPDVNFDDEEKINEFADEKQDREEFSEKEDKVEQVPIVESKFAPAGEIELEEDDCIHLEEDVRPSDYMEMLERQKQEHEQLCKVVEGFDRVIESEEDAAQIKSQTPERMDQEDERINEHIKQVENNERLSEEVQQLEKPLVEEYDRLSDKVEQELEKDERLSANEEKHHEDSEKSVEDREQPETETIDQKHEKDQQQQADKELNDQVEQNDEVEHYDIDESLSFETEKLEQERHLDDIEIMSQEFDRKEKEEQAEDRLNIQPLVDDVHSEAVHTENGQLDEPKTELRRIPEESHLYGIEEQILSHFGTEDNKLQSETAKEQSPTDEDLSTQPEKQCFEEPEKLSDKSFIQLPLQEEQQTTEHELPIEETENKLNEEDSFGETEKQLVECTEKQLAKIENQVLEAAPPQVKSVEKETKPSQEDEVDPENLEEVVEEIIIKEQVPIKASALPVSGQEPSAVPPTHESCDESDEEEWKYLKDGQGEKHLLSLQGDIVVEEELQQQLQEAGAPSSGTAFTEQLLSTADSGIKSIADTYDNLTQQLSAVAESAVNTVGDTLANLNISQSSKQEKLDNLEDEDLSASEMNSKLNPEAKEFVPTFSPPGTADVESEIANGFTAAPPSAIPPHFKDEVLAQSPRKGRESNMENIKIPAENEFDQEIAHKPHGLPGDEAIIDHAENGELYEEMNWKEAMHGSEKDEEPLVDSPVTEESIEVVDNVQAFDATQLLSEFSAPFDLDNAGMKESIYIENNTSVQSNEEDILNTVQMLPVDEDESKDNSFEAVSDPKNELISVVGETVPAKDVVSKEEVQKILTLASEDEKENKDEKEIEQKIEQLLLSHDKEITKDVQLETEQVQINGVEISPTTPEIALITTNQVEPVVEQAHEQLAPVELSSSPVPVADEALEGLTIGAAVAVAVAATTAAVKKVEAEKNQKNLSKTSSATKSKVPDTKKPAVGTTTKTSTASSVSAKRSLADKPKPAAASSLAAKKTIGSTTSAAPRPRTAPSTGAVKTPTEKKTTATTTTTSTAKSRIDTKPPLTARKPLVSSAAKTTTSKSTDDAKSSSITVRSSIGSKSAVGSKTSIGSTRTTPATNAISKPRPATASSVATTNGSATKTAASKPTTLAPKSAAPVKASLTSPRGTLTSTLRKTEAIKSPTKTTITLRVSTTNGTKTTTSTRTTTTKTTLSTVPSAAARSTTTSSATTRRAPLTGTTSTVGATTPTSKTSNLVPRKSTPLKKTSSTPPVRKSLGSKLNASATKPTKDTTTPRPVTIPAQHQHNNSIVAADEPKVLETLEPIPADNEQPKLNGIASLDDLPSPTVPVATHPLEMETA